MGPMFRHERPQKGRYRQFHQVGVEALGFAGPGRRCRADRDVRARCGDDLGLDGIRLQLNSLGAAGGARARTAQTLIALPRGARGRRSTPTRSGACTPIRCASSTRKNPAMQAVVAGAPQLIDYLGEASLAHFEALQALLTRRRHRRTRINPRLVRGLDYYNLTVFEWVTDRLGAQGTVCGGGRYDGLFEQLGGKPTPGLRLRHGHRAAARAAAASRAAAGARGAGRLRRAPGRGGAPLRVRASPSELRDAGRDRDPARRRRQLQVADEEGRRERRRARGDRRRRRSRRRRGDASSRCATRGAQMRERSRRLAARLAD